MQQQDPGQAARATAGASILVVDDDAGMRSALTRLFVAAGGKVSAFASGPELLASDLLGAAACIVLDLKMPGMDGLRVQAELVARQCTVPTLFLTGAADVPTAVRAMQAGAFDFIEKPFDNEHLLERVHAAIEHTRRQTQPQAGDDQQRAAFLSRLAALTPRERQVLDQVVTGQTSKQIARVLGASHRTIEIHRAHIMEKLDLHTLADLVRMHLRCAAPE